MNDYEILAELKKQTKIMERQARNLRSIDTNTFLVLVFVALAAILFATQLP